MTQQYLIGEVLLLLSRLQAEAHAPDARCRVEHLRSRAENAPPHRLGPVLGSAVPLADALCWQALGVGDMEAFERRSRIAEDIHAFGVCSGLVSGAW